MRAPLRLLCLLPVVAACSGDDGPSFRDLTPEIAVTPPALEAWTPQPLTLAPAPGQEPADVILGEYGTQEFFISNAGRADLDVVLTLEGDETFSVDSPGTTIDTDVVETFVVTFTPENFLEYEGRLIITSNDDENPEIVVPLRGKGIDAPRPDIDLNTQTIDFGTVDLGDEGVDFDTTLTNVGTAPLRLGTVTIEGSPAFRVEPIPEPGLSLGAGQSVPLVVFYEPLQEDTGDNGVMVIPSDDPDEPETRINLIGNGGGAFEYPEAIIDPCPTEVEIVGPQTVRLLGGTSFDPQDYYPLTYTWQTTRVPLGSATNVLQVRSELDQIDIPVDVAGEYDVTLVVHNDLDTPSPVTLCTMNVIPADDIRVELSWSGPSADLDLHLLNDPDAEMWSPDDDMHYCNRLNPPDWGESGGDDDPRLDIDDRGGFGPENINIGSPADAEYPIKVHYYSRGSAGAIETATVVVWAGGQKVYEGAQALDYNQVWDVGSVTWPDGTFSPGGGTPLPSSRRQCIEN